MESTKERDQLMELKKKNRELESALSDAHLDLRLERAWLKIACKAGGIDDVEAFKKKANGKPSTNQ